MPRNESASLAWTARTELLLELVRLDTAYADLYRQHARKIAAPELSASDFKALRNAESAVETLPGDIRRMMDDGKWDEVRKLTDELGAKQRFVAERGSLRKIGERLYEDETIQVDPFSPGFYWFDRREERQLPGLRDDALAKLRRAMELDPEWKPLYEERLKGLKAVRLTEPTASASGDAPRGRAETEARAREALASGNLEELQKLAGALQQGGAGPAGLDTTRAPEEVEPPPLSVEFTSQTLERAKGLGLELEHFENMRGKFRSLFRHLWHPVYFESEGNLPGARVSAMLPEGTSDAQRDRIALFVTRPVMSSGGARFLPPLVDEDVLVETFEEGPAGAELGRNGLAEALGLRQRWGLSRMQIERTLQEKGADLVKSLGLDPWKFRLVCVPPDLYGGIGQRRGWGKREIWTHFDGYLVTRDRKLMALAGGDTRYGGVFDLVGVGTEYDSDRLLARFAIVDRRRLRAW